jgi:hypothetical protein
VPMVFVGIAFIAFAYKYNALKLAK